MARKDLSRTVIEGGRYYHNRWQRRASHGVERASTRAWLDQVAVEVDEADASTPPPRKRVIKMFRDKLAPAWRWLLAQVGRPWSHVDGELRARFDTRTVAGRHVVHDHLLGWVRRHHVPSAYPARQELVIDRHGILRKGPWLRRSYVALSADTRAWAAGRVCALTYRGWWWFYREGKGGSCPTPWKCPLTHHVIERVAYHAVRITNGRALTRGEVRRLDRLPRELRATLVVPSPWPHR